MNFCSKNIERVPLFYCNFDSISFCVLTTSVLILDCNFKTTSTFLSVVSFKVYSTKKSSSQESDDKYVWDYDQGKFTDEIFGNICKRLHVNFPKWRKFSFYRNYLLGILKKSQIVTIPRLKSHFTLLETALDRECF